MYIGTEIKNRMRMFDMNIEKFVYATMLDSDYIAGVLDNRIPLSEIDEFDLNVIAAVLYCEPEYFYCKENRERDVVYSSSNRGDDTSKSRLAKARIQKLIRDILFLKEVTKR